MTEFYQKLLFKMDSLYSISDFSGVFYIVIMEIYHLVKYHIAGYVRTAFIFRYFDQSFLFKNKF